MEQVIDAGSSAAALDDPFDYLLAGDAALPCPTLQVPVQRWRSGLRDAVDEAVVEEVPVALVYDGISHAVMLASPQDLEDFAVGFSLGERIVAHRRDIHDLEVIAHAAGIEVRMRIDGGALQDLKRVRRLRTGKTGCGLCGIDSLEQFDAGTGTVGPGGVVGVDALHGAMAGLCAFQRIHAATGAAHAAGWSSWDGDVTTVREDVGRHNALDKLIGALARADVAPDSGFAVVTSRASFEMVQKAARAGFSMLVAVSAPTAMAVRMAQAAGLTLAGFARGDRHLVYTHGHRCAAC